jgi:hypothetical protein
MGRLPIYGKTAQIWEDFPYKGKGPKLIKQTVAPKPEQNYELDVGVILEIAIVDLFKP